MNILSLSKGTIDTIDCKSCFVLDGSDHWTRNCIGGCVDNFVLKDTEGLFCVWDQPLMSHVYISYCGGEYKKQ